MLVASTSPTIDFKNPPTGVEPEVDGGGVDFFNFSREELREFLVTKYGQPKFRADQLFEWVYKRGVLDPTLMTNISRDFRDQLASIFSYPAPTIQERLISSDGTRKYLFRFPSGDAVESVMIKQPARMTLCVSSQVGCGMGCSFCRTGTMGFRRNLTASEIIQQVRGVIEDAKQFDDMFSNIVFMGMGEPLHNVKNVIRAVQILTDDCAFEIGPRKITVSTSGLVPAIKKFGEANTNVNLAVSLNATTDEVRTKIMPVNKAFPLSVLLAALRDFPLANRKTITIEYVMLHGVNDTPDDLKRLPKLLRSIRCKVNLIPYNENAGLGFRSPPKDLVGEWQSALIARGIDATIRWSKGQDIKAACGQLASERPAELVAISQI